MGDSGCMRRWLAYVLWLKEKRGEREGIRAQSRAVAVAVPNGSQANRISNLVPLPTSEYHKDINISGPSGVAAWSRRRSTHHQRPTCGLSMLTPAFCAALHFPSSIEFRDGKRYWVSQSLAKMELINSAKTVYPGSQKQMGTSYGNTDGH